MDITKYVEEIRISNRWIKTRLTRAGWFSCRVLPATSEVKRVEFNGLLQIDANITLNYREYYDVCIFIRGGAKIHVGRVECRAMDLLVKSEHGAIIAFWGARYVRDVGVFQTWRGDGTSSWAHITASSSTNSLIATSS
jgi:hypothetical protein